MPRRIEPRWRTSFGRWLAGYTVPRVTASLSRRGLPTTPKAVYNWLAGATLPDTRRAHALERLSRGAVSLDDICRHQVVVRRSADAGVRSTSTPTAGVEVLSETH